MEYASAIRRMGSQQILSFYMGKNTPERKDYIMKNLVVTVEVTAYLISAALALFRFRANTFPLLLNDLILLVTDKLLFLTNQIMSAAKSASLRMNNSG